MRPLYDTKCRHGNWQSRGSLINILLFVAKPLRLKKGAVDFSVFPENMLRSTARMRLVVAGVYAAHRKLMAVR